MRKIAANAMNSRKKPNVLLLYVVYVIVLVVNVFPTVTVAFSVCPFGNSIPGGSPIPVFTPMSVYPRRNRNPAPVIDRMGLSLVNPRIKKVSVNTRRRM